MIFFPLKFPSVSFDFSGFEPKLLGDILHETRKIVYNCPCQFRIRVLRLAPKVWGIFWVLCPAYPEASALCSIQLQPLFCFHCVSVN